MLKYAGVPLATLTPPARALLDRRTGLREVLQHQTLPWGGQTPTNWPLFLTQRAVEVGTLYWPTGATRFALGQYVVSSAQYDAIRAVVYAGGVYTSATLELTQYDHTSTLVSTVSATAMWMLAPYPLAINPVEAPREKLYLLTLVDRRFWWWYLSTPAPWAAYASWSAIYDACAAALDITLDYEAVGAVYLTPPSDFAYRYQTAAELIDAVDAATGQKFVAHLDGTFVTQGSAAAHTAYSDALAAGSGTVYGGGDLAVPDTQPALPATIRTRFPDLVDGATASTFTSYDAAVSGLGIGAYYPSSGAFYSGVKVITAPQQAVYAGASLANGSGLSALATQFATDWARLRLAARNATHAGLISESVTGYTDEVEWVYRRDLVGTRFRQLPSADLPTPVAAALAPDLDVKDSYDWVVERALQNVLNSGALSAVFDDISNLPTQNRWAGLVNSERILFEGTSGGTTVGIVSRGYDGTSVTTHSGGAVVTEIAPHAMSGVGMLTWEKGQFVYPHEVSGVRGVRIVPQTQVVKTLTDVGRQLDGVYHYSGILQTYDASQASGVLYRDREYVWVVERNDAGVMSGRRYDGQFGGHSDEPAAPTYLIDTALPFGSGGTVNYKIEYGANGPVGPIAVNVYLSGVNNYFGNKNYYVSGGTAEYYNYKSYYFSGSENYFANFNYHVSGGRAEYRDYKSYYFSGSENYFAGFLFFVSGGKSEYYNYKSYYFSGSQVYKGGETYYVSGGTSVYKDYSTYHASGSITTFYSGGRFILPIVLVSGVSYSGFRGEVRCGSGFFAQYNGVAWEYYYPGRSTPTGVNSGHARLPGVDINVATGTSEYADWDYLNPEYDVGGYAASGGFIVPADKSGYHTLGAYGTTGDATEGAETGNVIMFIVVNDTTVIAGQSTGARDPNIPINTEHLCAHTNYGFEGGDKVAVRVTNNQDDTIQFSPQAVWISRLP